MNTPVAFLVYRRPDLTARVFAQIAQARPPLLLVVADGPRNEGERAACLQTRAVVDRIDWPCRVLRNFSDVNLGCRTRVASGLDWVFAQVEEAVILEDDCLPHPSFFTYCEAMLERHRRSERVMHIGGANFQPGPVNSGGYYVSKYTHVWGWASWRRAWRHYDVTMTRWPEFRRRGGLEAWCPRHDERRTWEEIFDRMYEGRVDTWDYAWTFACWERSGLSLVPAVNLVSNIGFGFQATHTHAEVIPSYAELPVARLDEFRDPRTLEPNAAADRHVFELMYRDRWSRIRRIGQLVLSRYSYGRLLRRMPILGPVWIRWRERRRAQVNT